MAERPFQLDVEDVDALAPVRQRHRVRDVFVPCDTVEELVLRLDEERIR